MIVITIHADRKERMQQEIWFQKYRIIKLLGSGGTAKVYLAEHIKLNSYRAIKCISITHPLYNLLRKEAFILKNLEHSCIPIIYDIEEDEYGSYIIEQYIEGETLSNYVKVNGILKEDTIIHYSIQICDLIHYLHSNERPILYLDLKPDNIIITQSELKLIDFGSAVYLDELKEEQDYLSTRGYAAPELYGRNVIDERSDVYSVGMLLFYMATGFVVSKDEVDIENIDYVGNCSMQFKNIINRCLKINSSQRYATIIELRRELSVMKQNHQNHQSMNLSVRIAVAGAQERIGTTHVAFRICCYYNQIKMKSLYLEKNSSNCIWSIKNRYERTEKNREFYKINGFLALEKGDEKIYELSSFPIIVEDYGRLTKENRKDFLQADVKILILGTKDWELSCSEQALNLVTEYKDMIYLFNFLNDKQFHQVIRSMKHKLCYRIPYEPDPFAKPTDRNGIELLCELNRLVFSKAKEWKKHEKKTNTFKAKIM